MFFVASFVSSKTFHYSQQSVEDMLQAVAICEDSEEFNIDCGSIIWDEYIKRMVLGLQKYILKSDESLLAQNRRTLKGFVLIVYKSTNIKFNF